MQVVSSSSPHTGTRDFARYPLLDALLRRRSRRFARGMHLDGGPLAYASTHPPQPISLEEEAALAFAACGAGLCGLQIRRGTGNVSRWRQRDRLARWSCDPIPGAAAVPACH